MEELIIDRGTWLHGEGSNASMLRREYDGKKCCLGFYLKGRGARDHELQSAAHPVGLLNVTDTAVGKNVVSEWLTLNEVKGARASHSEDALLLMELNDYPLENEKRKDQYKHIKEGELCSQEQREKRIIEVFARNDVKVTFTGVE